MVFPNKIALEYDLSCIIGKSDISFSRKYHLIIFRQKMKDDLSQKNTWKYDIFCKCSEKMVFPRNSHWNMVFLQLSRNKIFLFSRNMISFFIFLLRTDMFKSSCIIENKFSPNQICTCMCSLKCW